MEELIYHYKAFISHTECDSQWAKKLHTKLNNYSIPSKIKKAHPDLPKNLRPVFWYKRDISELHLKNTIRKELYNSEYLIVICSPQSAKSIWVNEEVRIFKEEFGREYKIIPFIVDGTANSSNPDEECFPQLLRNLPIDEQIRGIDVRGEDGEEGAYINVIASMLRVRYDELYQRYIREKRKKIYRTIAAFAITILASLFTCDYFFNTKYEYFLDYADCDGKPTGLMSIDKQQAKQEYRSYRFEYLRGTLRRVVYVDSNGNTQPMQFTEYIDRFPIQELLYENGEYVGIECKSHLGDIICKYNYSKTFNSVNISDDEDDLSTSLIRSASSITNDEERKATSHFIDNILISPSKIGRYEYDRDSAGYISAIYYCKNPYQSQRTTDINGIAGIKYTRDSLHRVMSLQYIDLKGNPKVNEYGIAQKRYTYDSQGHLSVSEYFNINGDLQPNELGWAKAIVEYDQNGYPLKQSQFGKDGKPCKSIIGESITKYEWTATTQKASFFDEDGEPIIIHGSASIPGGYHSTIQTYDANGDVVKIEYLDLDGQLCYNTFHWAISRQTFYNRRPTEQSYWSPIDEPCYNYNYIHRIRQEYLDDLIISESFWGPNGTRISGPTGFHSIYFEYTHNRVSGIKTYNISNTLCPTPTLSNAAQVEIIYDGDYPSTIIFKDVNGKASADPQRQLDNPMVPYRDWAICRIKNENGMNTEYSYFNEDDKKMLCFGLYHKKEIEYNDVGKEVRTRFYDSDNYPAPNEAGIYASEIQYNTENPHLQSCILFKNGKGELLNNNMGVAKTLRTYYPNGNLESESYFNEDHEPTNVFGAHRYIYEYDNLKRQTSATAMGTDNTPAINTTQKCHRVENVYDNLNRVVELRRYNTDNKLITRPYPAISRYTYGSDHQILKNEFLDNNHAPCNNPDAGGIATAIMEYDQLGRKTHEKYLDENNDATINNSLGYAECRAIYNGISKVVYSTDEYGYPTNSSGICRLFEIYSDNSLPLLFTTYRVNYDDELEICWRYINEYDNNGQPTFNYMQDNMGNITTATTHNTHTVNKYLDDEEDEYNTLLEKLDALQDSIISTYFQHIPF